MKMKTYQTDAASPKGGIKRARSEPTVGNNGQATKATHMKATELPPKASKKVEPKEDAQIAVATLIHTADDARRLFGVLRRFAAELEESQSALDEPLEAVVELGTLLDTWELHLPAGHQAGDAQFWSDVATACGDASEELNELNSLEFGIARVLFGAIEKAALVHLDEAGKRG